MAGEQRELDGQTGVGERLAEGPDRLRAPGEPVEDEHAVRPVRRSERFGTGNEGGDHGFMVIRLDR
jgi:hypothetical protein